MVNVLLFFIYFYTQELRMRREKYHGFGYAVDYSVHSVESRFSCPSLLYHDDRHICESRGHCIRFY